MSNRCPVSEAELKHDGGGTMSESEQARNRLRVIESKEFAAFLLDIIADQLTYDDAERIAKSLFACADPNYAKAGAILKGVVKIRAEKRIALLMADIEPEENEGEIT